MQDGNREDPLGQRQTPLSLNMQQLGLKMQQAADPHLTQAHEFTQIVNNSIKSLQHRKQMAEDTMNMLTEVIELRSSCQMVWSSLDQIEKARKEQDPSKFDLQPIENAVYFMSKTISVVNLLGEYDQVNRPNGLLKP